MSTEPNSAPNSALNPAASARADPRATLRNCRYCLMCRHADPVSHVTFSEALTPHGVALTAVSVGRGLLGWTPDTLAVLYSEADAGVARAHCATDQPFSEAVAAVRAEVAAAGLAPAHVYALRERLVAHGSLWGEGASQRAEGRSETALFVGDESVYLWPEALEAAQTLLSALGHAAAPLGVGRNSGLMALSLGFPELARAQAAALLDELTETGARRVVALGPGDHYALTQAYPERLEVPWPEGADVVELSVLLAEAVERGEVSPKPLTLDAPYAYVDPTHSVRRLARTDAPRRVLDALLSGERRELFWRRERAHPVGSTALQFTRPELADKLTRARLDDAQSRGVRHLVCDDPATLYQLGRLAPEYGLTVHGLYELAAQTLGHAQAGSLPADSRR